MTRKKQGGSLPPLHPTLYHRRVRITFLGATIRDTYVPVPLSHDAKEIISLLARFKESVLFHQWASPIRRREILSVTAHSLATVDILLLDRRPVPFSPTDYPWVVVLSPDPAFISRLFKITFTPPTFPDHYQLKEPPK